MSGESLVDLSARAGSRALALAETDPAEVDLVLVATFTPDELQPHAAPQVAMRVGAIGAGAVDVGAACTGFLSALSLAAAQVDVGRARAALVVGADVISRVTDYSDLRTAGLFGDGAGAAVVTPGGPGAVGEILLRSDAGGADLIRASNDERLIRMDGRATFRAAVAAMSDVSREVVSDAGVALDEIDLFVYHQANSRIITAVGARLELPADRVIDCIAEYGNTSAASIPIALSEAAADGTLRPGAKVLLCAFGAGLTWGRGNRRVGRERHEHGRGSRTASPQHQTGRAGARPRIPPRLPPRRTLASSHEPAARWSPGPLAGSAPPPPGH